MASSIKKTSPTLKKPPAKTPAPKTAAPVENAEDVLEIGREIEETAKELAGEIVPAAPINFAYGDTWKKADDLVTSFRPVPWVVLVMIRGVMCRPSKSDLPSPYIFDALSGLLVQASFDPILSSERPLRTDQPTLPLAVETLGSDVAAAICFIHSVCRRIAYALPERIWKPIIDDALLRAQIGYFVGACSPAFGHGSGMLAGFAGRCGLAIQIGSGDMVQASKALEMLAHGIPLRDVGLRIYGCEPLQVSALSLAAGGCGREAALGTASYASEGRDLPFGSEQFRWLSAFAISEELRMGRPEAVNELWWQALGFADSHKRDLKKKVQKLQREGHSLNWITLPQLMMENAPKEKHQDDSSY